MLFVIPKWSEIQVHVHDLYIIALLYITADLYGDIRVILLSPPPDMCVSHETNRCYIFNESC